MGLRRVRIVLFLPISREFLRHPGVAASDRQRIDGVMAVIGAGLLTVSGQNVV